MTLTSYLSTPVDVVEEEFTILLSQLNGTQLIQNLIPQAVAVPTGKAYVNIGAVGTAVVQLYLEQLS